MLDLTIPTYTLTFPLKVLQLTRFQQGRPAQLYTMQTIVFIMHFVL